MLTTFPILERSSKPRSAISVGRTVKGNRHMKTKTYIIYAAFALFAFACFALTRQAYAVCQDGCLGNANTVLGDDALVSLTTGTDNTAVGNGSLTSNTTGNFNTATGGFALSGNTTGNDNTANGASALANNPP